MPASDFWPQDSQMSSSAKTDSTSTLDTLKSAYKSLFGSDQTRPWKRRQLLLALEDVLQHPNIDVTDEKIQKSIEQVTDYADDHRSVDLALRLLKYQLPKPKDITEALETLSETMHSDYISEGLDEDQGKLAHLGLEAMKYLSNSDNAKPPSFEVALHVTGERMQATEITDDVWTAVAIATAIAAVVRHDPDDLATVKGIDTYSEALRLLTQDQACFGMLTSSLRYTWSSLSRVMQKQTTDTSGASGRVVFQRNG